MRESRSESASSLRLVKVSLPQSCSNRRRVRHSQLAQGTFQVSVCVSPIGFESHWLLLSMLTALSVTDDPSGTPRTGRFSVVFADTCLTNVSVPFWMTYTLTAVAQLLVKWMFDSAVVGAVRTDAERGPQALLVIVATASPSATQNLFIGISSHAANRRPRICGAAERARGMHDSRRTS